MEHREIVKEARKLIESKFSGKEYHSNLEGEAGVFVTLKKGKKLRGCIGLPSPVPLSEGLRKAALGATEDPRFPPLTEEELDEVTINVTLMSEPELVENPLEDIEVGRNGIIIKRGFSSGLLLPQVAVEQGWGVEAFLDHCCLKAGLPPDSWKDQRTRIYKFEGKVFREESE